MPNTIDERVVKMSFDNAEFAKNVAQTLADLEKLQKSLKLQGAAKGLQDLSGAAGKVDLGHIGAAVDSIKSKFSAMSVIGIAAMASLAAKAVDTGLRVVKSFTLDPITAGFHNYETQINAVQTILANTGLKGAAGMAQVNKVLSDLNNYANQTVYNFSEMTQNIGTFTAAGVKLDVAASSIKGIANLAAMSGSNSQQASMAMYQLSQAIAANQVHLQDWNSVVNAGLGGQVFQKALYNTGVALHTI
jgi:tape measure domain-containing protein